jgi:opine dehydrogenase
MRFCVIGAGNGGKAFAAYLCSKGHDVNIYNRSYSGIAEIIKKGTIRSTGVIKGTFPIKLATQDMGLALKDVDVILIVTPAFAHKDIANLIAPYLTKDQIIILNPGRTFGAAEFKKIISDKIGKIPLFIAETQTLLFTSRQLEKNKVQILKIKNSVDFCALPEKHNFFLHDTLKDVFPQLNPIDDYLEVTLRNVGMFLHPAISLMNAGFMDIGKDFKFYKEGATFHTCEVLEQIQFEINQIFEKLGLKRFNFCNWAKKSYGVSEKSIHDALQSILAYQDISAPKQLITRYFTEDVPTGLVPISSLADYLEIETPTINSIIHLSTILCRIDFKKDGRNFEELDLNDYVEKKLKVQDLSGEISDQYKEIPV